MQIALIGYGKMGKAIETVAKERGHTIAITIDQINLQDFTKENFKKIDVAIEFTSPHTAYDNVKKCLEFQVPIVCGSTGWTESLEKLKQYAAEHNGSFIYSSNFSVGVNIFFELNKKLAQLMAGQTSYTVHVEETHHTQKKDAPSGTAISLAEQILQIIPNKTNWVNDATENINELSILSKRIDPAPGTHNIKYSSPIDDIEIIHTAHNRTGFATGAVLAAEYIQGKNGFFEMKDVLGI